MWTAERLRASREPVDLWVTRPTLTTVCVVYLLLCGIPTTMWYTVVTVHKLNGTGPDKRGEGVGGAGVAWAVWALESKRW